MLTEIKNMNKTLIINQMEIKSNFEYEKIQSGVIKAYNKVSKSL